MPSEEPRRSTPQRRAATGEVAQATTAERTARVAAEEAVEAEQITLAAAAEAVEAARQAEWAAAASSPPLLLIPGDQLQELVTSLVRGMRDVIQPAPTAGGAAAVEPSLDRDQARLVLGYDALRTALGRRSAAALVLYRVVAQRQERTGRTQVGIRIESGPVSAGNWIVIYGRDRNQDKSRGEIGRAEYRPDDEMTSWVPVNVPDPVISALEVWDSRNGHPSHPIRLGRRLADETRSRASRARR